MNGPSASDLPPGRPVEIEVTVHVLAWAEMHAAELEENWRRAREGATLHEIEPLR